MKNSVSSVCAGSEKLAQVRRRYGFSNTRSFMSSMSREFPESISICSESSAMGENKELEKPLVNISPYETETKGNTLGFGEESNQHTKVADVLRNFQLKLASLQEKINEEQDRFKELEAENARIKELKDKEQIKLAKNEQVQNLLIYTHDYCELFTLLEKRIRKIVTCRSAELFIVKKSATGRFLWTIDKQDKKRKELPIDSELSGYAAITGKTNVQTTKNMYPTMSIPLFKNDTSIEERENIIGVFKITKELDSQFSKEEANILERFCVAVSKSIVTCTHYEQKLQENKELKLELEDHKQKAFVAKSSCNFLQEKFAKKMFDVKKDCDQEKQNAISELNEKWVKELALINTQAENRSIAQQLFRRALETRDLSYLSKACSAIIPDIDFVLVSVVDTLPEETLPTSDSLSYVVKAEDGSKRITALVLLKQIQVAKIKITFSAGCVLNQEIKNMVKNFALLYVIPIVKQLMDHASFLKSKSELALRLNKLSVVETSSHAALKISECLMRRNCSLDEDLENINSILLRELRLEKIEVMQLSEDKYSKLILSLASLGKNSIMLPLLAVDEANINDSSQPGTTSCSQFGENFYLYMHDEQSEYLETMEDEIKTRIIPILRLWISRQMQIARLQKVCKSLEKIKVKDKEYIHDLYTLVKQVCTAKTENELNAIVATYISQESYDIHERTDSSTQQYGREITQFLKDSACRFISTLQELDDLKAVVDNIKVGAEVLHSEMSNDKEHIEAIHNTLAHGVASCAYPWEFMEIVDSLIRNEFPAEACYVCVDRFESGMACFGTGWKEDMLFLPQCYSIEATVLTTGKTIIVEQEESDIMIHPGIEELLQLNIENVAAFPLKLANPVSNGKKINRIRNDNVFGVFILVNAVHLNGLKKIEAFLGTASPIFSNLIQTSESLQKAETQLRKTIEAQIENDRHLADLQKSEKCILATLTKCSTIGCLHASLFMNDHHIKVFQCESFKICRKESEEESVHESDNIRVYPITSLDYELRVTLCNGTNFDGWCKNIEPIILRIHQYVDLYIQQLSIKEDLESKIKLKTEEGNDLEEKIKTLIKDLDTQSMNAEINTSKLENEINELEKQLIQSKAEQSKTLQLLEKSESHIEHLKSIIKQEKEEKENEREAATKTMLKVQNDAKHDKNLQRIRFEKLSRTLDREREDLKKIRQRADEEVRKHSKTKEQLDLLQEQKRNVEIELEETNKANKKSFDTQIANMKKLEVNYSSKLVMAQNLCKKYQEDSWNREHYYESVIEKEKNEWHDVKNKLEQSLIEQNKALEMKQRELEIEREIKSVYTEREKKFLRGRETKQSNDSVHLTVQVKEKKRNKLGQVKSKRKETLHKKVRKTRPCCRNKG